jgi:hypothetical protein
MFKGRFLVIVLMLVLEGERGNDQSTSTRKTM